MKWIYKITYPNGKIYIGKDLTGTFSYFGSPNSKLIEVDFPNHENDSFVITREILWKSETSSNEEINKKEVELIRQFQSNNPEVGYNRWPKFIK